jgi:hypothetical protein
MIENSMHFVRNKSNMDALRDKRGMRFSASPGPAMPEDQTGHHGLVRLRTGHRRR